MEGGWGRCGLAVQTTVAVSRLEVVVVVEVVVMVVLELRVDVCECVQTGEKGVVVAGSVRLCMSTALGCAPFGGSPRTHNHTHVVLLLKMGTRMAVACVCEAFGRGKQ